MIKKILNRVDSSAIIAITIAIMAYCAAAPLFWKWLRNSYIGKVLKWLYCTLPDYPLLSLLLSTLITIVVLIIGRRWYKDWDKRWYRPLLLIMGLLLLHLGNDMSFADVIGNFSYKWLFTILLLGLIMTLILKHVLELLRLKKKKDDKVLDESEIRLDQNLAVCFTVDDTDTSKASKEERNYARSIVAHLMGTNLKEHSFAIGITGEWGEGKTLFLEVIEEELEGKAEVVKFNPWLCRTPEQLTEDFFVALRQQLSKKHSTLSRPIIDYARYVNNATFNVGSGFWTKLTLNMPHESLQEKKRKLSERFLALKQPVVVIIDDIDRLDEEEVYEVLRLIRNTADLCNVIYVVAYDKGYVTAVLSEKKIKDGTAYLEKIFNVEAHKPKVEVSQLENVMRAELSNYPKYREKFANMVFDRIDQPSKKVMFDILNNYRRVKRFARLYLLNVDYLMSIYSGEVKLMDLFWMELLQTYDIGMYKALFDEPTRYLYIEDEKYHLRSGIYKDSYYPKKEQSQSYKGIENWNPNTPYLLHLLFDSNVNVTHLSMRYVENYKKYFTFGVTKFNLSVKEVKVIFDRKKEPEEIVVDWLKEGKYFSSVLFQLEHLDLARLTGEDVRRYIIALLFLGCYPQFYQWRLNFKMKTLLTVNRYNNMQQDIARGYFLQWCFNMAKDIRNLIPLSRLLKHLYIPQVYDEDGNKTAMRKCIYTNSDIEMLLNEIMKTYLNHHPELLATAIMQEKTETGQLFKNCCVMVDEGTVTEEYNKWINLAFKTVIKHFADKRDKPTLADYNAAYGQMFMEDRPSADIDDYDYEDFLRERFENSVETYFGSDNDDMVKFKEKCFEK